MAEDRRCAAGRKSGLGNDIVLLQTSHGMIFSLIPEQGIFFLQADGKRRYIHGQITSGDAMSAFRYTRSMTTVFSVERQFLGGT